MREEKVEVRDVGRVDLCFRPDGFPEDREWGNSRGSSDCKAPCQFIGAVFQLEKVWRGKKALALRTRSTGRLADGNNMRRCCQQKTQLGTLRYLISYFSASEIGRWTPEIPQPEIGSLNHTESSILCPEQD